MSKVDGDRETPAPSSGSGEVGPTLCPSSRCDEGAILLGVVRAEGRVAFLPDRTVVGHDFVEIATRGRAPEKRFRFSSPCAQSGCREWTGTRCRVLDTVYDCLPREGGTGTLPECSIRAQCRWYLQEGEKACSVCPFVVTDLMVDDA